MLGEGRPMDWQREEEKKAQAVDWPVPGRSEDQLVEGPSRYWKVGGPAPPHLTAGVRLTHGVSATLPIASL